MTSAASFAAVLTLRIQARWRYKDHKRKRRRRGVRRIEAITGNGLYRHITEEDALINETAETLKTQPSNIAVKAAALTDEVKWLTRRR